MKKIYFRPSTTVSHFCSELPLVNSNVVNNAGIDMNKSTMESGSGDDAAVKRGNYSIWEDNWHE